MKAIRFLLRPIWLPILEVLKVGAAIGRFVVLNWPNTPFGIFLRRKYMTLRSASVGKNLLMLRGCDIGGYHLMRIGDNSGISEGVVVNLGPGDHELRIGSNTFLGPGIYIRNMNHRFDDVNALIDGQGHTGTDIVIGDDVWIGARCILLAGTRIGDHSVVGAGSVVLSEIPPYSVAAGNPARVVKMRLSAPAGRDS